MRMIEITDHEWDVLACKPDDYLKRYVDLKLRSGLDSASLASWLEQAARCTDAEPPAVPFTASMSSTAQGSL